MHVKAAMPVQAKTASALALAAAQLQTAGTNLLGKLKKPKNRAKPKSAGGKASKASQPSGREAARPSAKVRADAGGGTAGGAEKKSEAALKGRKSKPAPQQVRFTRSSAR